MKKAKQQNVYGHIKVLYPGVYLFPSPLGYFLYFLCLLYILFYLNRTLVSFCMHCNCICSFSIFLFHRGKVNLPIFKFRISKQLHILVFEFKQWTFCNRTNNTLWDNWWKSHWLVIFGDISLCHSLTKPLERAAPVGLPSEARAFNE